MKISIKLQKNNNKEKQTKADLESLLVKYDLEKYILCSEIIIEQGATGKAFPSIRLSAWMDNEEGLLAQFIHEQLHWIEKGNEEQMQNAINEIKSMFPDAPVDRPEGGGSERSTYVHLIICRLELLALGDILGEEKAKNIVSSNNNYTWIREKVISKGDDIDNVIRKHFPKALNI